MRIQARKLGQDSVRNVFHGALESVVGSALEDVLTWTLEVVKIGNKLCLLNTSQPRVFPLCWKTVGGERIVLCIC